MPDFFSTQSADIIDKYKSIVSFKEYKHIEDDNDLKTYLVIKDVEEPEYQHIKDQFFIVEKQNNPASKCHFIPAVFLRKWVN